MEFNLTIDQKNKMLQDSKNAIHSELFLLLVKMGIDPDAYILGDDIGNDPKFSGEKTRFEGLTYSLQMIEEKLSDFE